MYFKLFVSLVWDTGSRPRGFLLRHAKVIYPLYLLTLVSIPCVLDESVHLYIFVLLSIYLFVCLSNCLLISISISLPVWDCRPDSLSEHRPVRIFAYWSVCLCECHSAHLSVYRSASMSECLSVYLPVCSRPLAGFSVCLILCCPLT